VIRIRHAGYWPAPDDMPAGSYDVELLRTDVLNGEIIMTLRYLGPSAQETGGGSVRRGKSPD